MGRSGVPYLHCDFCSSCNIGEYCPSWVRLHWKSQFGLSQFHDFELEYLGDFIPLNLVGFRSYWILWSLSRLCFGWGWFNAIRRCLHACEDAVPHVLSYGKHYSKIRAIVHLTIWYFHISLATNVCYIFCVSHVFMWFTLPLRLSAGLYCTLFKFFSSAYKFCRSVF